MKVIVAGSRHFKDEGYVHLKLSEFAEKNDITSILDGGATGPDSFGRIWADKNGIEVLSFPANWERYGNQAGPIRNSEMARNADFLVAFWDGESSGTKDMISKMRSRSIVIRISKQFSLKENSIDV